MESLLVFEILQNTISPIGLIDDFTSLVYTKYASDVGSFELVMPYSPDYFDLLKRNNDLEKIVLLDDNVFGICHKVNPKSGQGTKSIVIQGTLINGFLDNYCVPKIERLVTATTSPQNILNFPLSLQYVLQNLPNNISGDFWGGIHYALPNDYQDLSWVFENGYIGGNCTFADYIQNCVRLLNKAYSVDYNQNGYFDLVLYSPKDRTVNQSVNNQVLLSTNFGDILSSEFSVNSKNYKNIIVAYSSINDVLYEEVVTYDGMDANYPTQKKRVGYEEVVLSEYDDSGRQLTSDDILGLLRQKGKEILYGYALVSEYTCKLNQQNTFKCGVDYFVGDKITIQDNRLGLVLDASVSGYTKTISTNGVVFEPIIGIPQPSLTRMLKQKGVI